MATKIEHVQDAYSQLRISGLTVQPSPADLSLALTRFENMMAELDGSGLCLGYNFEALPEPDTESGLEPYAYSFVASNIAIRVAPDFNKVIPQTLINQASQSFSVVSGIVAARDIRQVQAPSTMPLGSGNRRFNRYNRYNVPVSQAVNKCSSNFLKLNDIDDYSENYQAYLDEELLDSYAVTVSSGLTLVSHSKDGDLVNYRISAGSVGFQTVDITITTDTGRVDNRTIEFEVS